MRIHYSFTLIEVLVGFSLFAGLMAILMLSIRFMTMQKAHLEKASQSIKQKTWIYSTIARHIDAIVLQGSNTFEIKQNGSIQLLSFTSSGHIDRDPLFCDQRHITLTLDHGSLVCIETPMEPSRAKRIYQLKDRVSSLAFKLIQCSTSTPFLATEVKQYDVNALPLAMQMSLKVEGKEEVYTFLLPLGKKPILEFTRS